MTPIEITLFMLAVFLVVLFLGHPLASTLGGLAVIFGFLFWGDGNILAMFARTCTKTATTISYICIPLFIFMGCLLERSGVSERLFESMYVVLGRLRGGLGITTVLICALMGAATGIIGASITIMGMLALPSMIKYRYDKRMAAGTVMAAGSLGTMIPPSVILVIYGSLAQLSIAKLFAGGLIVGLLLAGLYMAYIAVRTILDKNAGPPINPEESARYSFGEKVKMVVLSIIPPIALIITVLGSLLTGVSTPNEAAALGCVGALLIAVAFKKCSWRMIKESCFQTMLASAMVMWIILAASMFTTIFMGLRGGAVVQEMVTGVVANKWVVLALILFLIFVMGMIIDTYGILLIGVPLFTPIIYKMGFDPLWFGMLFAIMVQVSVLSPPFAYAAFYLKGVAPKEIGLNDLYWAAMPFIALQITAVVLVCLFPGIATWLPSKI